ncbi:MAG: T9SS type A sorting domain-containing protein [Bacteroidetes bacterium]|jgi:hypothetical protein|nr:T9SS type A sorting domain-containing protein [Bacteroidota bacterium]
MTLRSPFHLDTGACCTLITDRPRGLATPPEDVPSTLASLGSVLLALLLFGSTFGSPAAAQRINVVNGATMRVSNDAVMELHNTTLDFGSVGSTARLEETSNGRVTGGTLVATRMLNSPSGVDVAGLGAVISADQDLGGTIVFREHDIQSANGNESIARYYDIYTESFIDLDATLVFTYHEAELNGIPETELELFQMSLEGARWAERGYDSRNPKANTVTLSGIARFSRWTLGSEANPLPVELAAFDAQLDGTTVRLTWDTASETNNAGFRIERRQQASTWTSIGFIEGHGTTNEPQQYTFVDANLPFEADSLTYRLRQVDTHGAETLSSEVEVSLPTPERLTLHSNFPNPFHGRTTIRYELPQAAHIQLDVYDMLGRRIRTLVDARQRAGRQQVQFNAAALPSGVYVVRLTSDGATRTQTIAVVR